MDWIGVEKEAKKKNRFGGGRGGGVERTKGYDQKREKRMKNVIRREHTHTHNVVCCSTNQPEEKGVVRLRSFVHSQQTNSQQQHLVKVK